MNFSRLRRVIPRSRDLIGPPDPISNIRPVIIDGNRPSSSRVTHPYSLSEFTTEDEDADLQWRIERERLIAFNHAFWYDSNTRFMQGKQQILTHFQRLPMDDQIATKEKERALSAFYSRWSLQESARQAAYTEEWNARNHAIIRLAIRRQLRIWKEALKKALSRN